MLRKAKIGLWVLILIGLLLGLTNTIKAYNEESLPGMTVGISVTAWDEKKPKAKIFETLKDIGKQTHVDLALMHTVQIAGMNAKQVHYFSGQPQSREAFFKQTKVTHMSDRAVQTTDVRGVYLTNGSPAQVQRITQAMTNQGLTWQVADYRFTSFAARMVVNEGLWLPLLSVITLLLVVMVLEKIANFKRYAISELNGVPTRRIIWTDLTSTFKVIAVVAFILVPVLLGIAMSMYTIAGQKLFLASAFTLIGATILLMGLLDGLSYGALFAIDINAMIKGKAPASRVILLGYLCKVGLLFVLCSNVLALGRQLNQYHRERELYAIWQKSRTGYILDFAPVRASDAETARLGDSVKQMMNLSKGVIVSRNSQAAHPSVHSISADNGNVMFVNRNYLTHNDLPKQNQQPIRPADLDDHKINVLVPASRTDQLAKLQRELIDYLRFQATLSQTAYTASGGPSAKDFAVITMQTHFRALNYSTMPDIDASISTDPIVVVINDDTVSNDFYWATASQGLVQFTDLDAIQRNVQTVGLTNAITGITDAKTRIEDLNAQTAQRLTVIFSVVVLSLIQLSFVVSFLGLAFLQTKRQWVSLAIVFGRSNWRTFGELLGSNLVVNLAVLAFYVAAGSSAFLVAVFSVYTAIELLTLAVVGVISTRGVQKTLNRGN